MGVCLCSALSRIEGMKGVVQRLQQHFVVAFGGATSVPGMEFQGENPWCVLRRSYLAMAVFRYRYLVEGIA